MNYLNQLIHPASGRDAKEGDLVFLRDSTRARLRTVPTTAGFQTVYIERADGKTSTVLCSDVGLTWRYPHRCTIYHDDIVEYKGLRFRVRFPRDSDSDASWERGDGYGIISDHTNRPKRPGERVIGDTDHGYHRLYDVQATMQKALKEGWDAAPYTGTKGERAARAVQRDYEFHDGWLRDQWEFVIVQIECLDADYEHSCGGYETLDDYHMAEAWRMIEAMAETVLRDTEEQRIAAEAERVRLQLIADEFWSLAFESFALDSYTPAMIETKRCQFNELVAHHGVTV